MTRMVRSVGQLSHCWLRVVLDGRKRVIRGISGS